jgi:hypothetical protein
MNFSTVPPKCSSAFAEVLPARREERPHVLRVHLLGARGESDEVGEEHVTTFRSSRLGGGASSGAPQLLQKGEFGGLSRPQAGHVAMSRV